MKFTIVYYVPTFCTKQIQMILKIDQQEVGKLSRNYKLDRTSDYTMTRGQVIVMVIAKVNKVNAISGKVRGAKGRSPPRASYTRRVTKLWQ